MWRTKESSWRAWYVDVRSGFLTVLVFARVCVCSMLFCRVQCWLSSSTRCWIALKPWKRFSCARLKVSLFSKVCS